MTAWVLPGSAEAARRAAEAKLRAHVWPPELLAALSRLAADGHRALLVGGSVRDVILGRIADARWDVGTDRLPEDVRALFERTEGIGERHGTVLVLWQGLLIECTTFRREGRVRRRASPGPGVVHARSARGPGAARLHRQRARVRSRAR